MHNFNFDQAAERQLALFAELFWQYNQHTNISAIRDKDAIWQKHIADSLKLLEFEILGGKVLDIGTGGGMPGIPLAIARPKSEMVLLDSVGKKIRACEYFITELKLENTKTLHGRAEKLGQEKEYTGSFDTVVSRATAYLPTILAWAEHFIKPGGKIVLYKTPSSEELADGKKAAKKLGLYMKNQYDYELDGQTRKIIVYTRN